MFKKIPCDVESFHSFISSTDDCQINIDTIGYTIYPVDADGAIDFQNKEAQKQLKNQPMYTRWEWTADESLAWSAFRKKDNGLYALYTAARGAKQEEFKKQLEQNIHSCMKFDEAHHLVEKVANSGHTMLSQLEAFSIRQDVLKYETPMRTITINYEKEISLTDYEKQFIEQYVALHKQTVLQLKALCLDIKQSHHSLPGLWEQFPVLKEKADKATNTIFLPPPSMKGAWSDVVQVMVPTTEELQQQVNDFNRHSLAFHKQVDELCQRCNLFQEKIYDDDDGEYDKEGSLFNLVRKMQGHLIDNWKSYSIETCNLSDDWDEFLSAYDELKKDADKAWDDYIKDHNLFMDLNNAFVDFLNEKFSGDEQPAETSAGSATDAAGEDSRTETIARYEADLKLHTNTYFDISDWHIILDHYQQKYDTKNKDLALEKAFRQHSENATLFIRKAQQKADEHLYKEALDLFKQAEDQGPPHHPNFYYIKANVYCQMHAPEQAIPLYNKLIAAQGIGLEWFHSNARQRLIEIYAEQSNYAECIRLCKELLDQNPEDEETLANLAAYYCENGKPKDAEQLLIPFLEKHPESAICHEQLGHVYKSLKQYLNAITHFDAAYELDKQENYGNLYNEGEALMELKRFDEAVICFETCILYYKLESDYHLRAAQCYAELKYTTLASYHYRMALKLDPDCNEALQALTGTKQANPLN
jgi:tetratricopeptide (TPR) repeat protein